MLLSAHLGPVPDSVNPMCGCLQGLTYSEVSGHFFAVEEVYDSGTVAGLMGQVLCHIVCQPAACTHTRLTLSVMLR